MIVVALSMILYKLRVVWWKVIFSYIWYNYVYAVVFGCASMAGGRVRERKRKENYIYMCVYNSRSYIIYNSYIYIYNT